MIDFATAMRDQDDLETLCSRPIAPDASEVFGKNSGYGFGRILKEYAGYPLDRAVQAVIPHGVYLDATRMLEYERDAPVPAVLNYPAFRAPLWETTTEKIVVPSASPFVYALAMFREAFPERPDRCGTLFFTAHADDAMNLACDYGRVIDELQGLDTEFNPVTVCVSSVDFHQGNHEQFQRRGLDVVCAGQPEDQDFTFRWLHLLSRHRYAASTDLGGYACQSVRAGVPFFLTERRRSRTFDVSAYIMGPTPSPQACQTAERLREMFSSDRGSITPAARDTIDYLLGAESMKSPEGLKADLEHVASLAG